MMWFDWEIGVGHLAYGGSNFDIVPNSHDAVTYVEDGS